MHQILHDGFSFESSDSNVLLAEVVALIGRKDYQARELAFVMLYECYQDPIKRYLVAAWVHNQEHAAELCQDTFTRVWKCFQRQDKILLQIQTVNHLRNWIYKIAKRVAIDDLRRKKIDFCPLPADSEVDNRFAELTVEGHENRICDGLWFQEGIAQVPLKYRKPLLLKYHDGYSQKEIAEIYGSSEAAVSMNVNSGKTQLRKYFQVAVGQQREIQNRQNWGQEALKLLSSMRDDLDVFILGWIPASPELDEFLPSGGSKFIDEAVQRVVNNTNLLNNSRVKQGNKREHIEAKLIEVDRSGELLAWIRTLITYNSHH